jgi:hypothetical protein
MKALSDSRFVVVLGLCLLTLPVVAQVERDAGGAQEAVKAELQGELTPEEAAAKARPKNMPDLTKGEKIPVPAKGGLIIWNLGPTGIIGIKNAGFAGDQVQVVGVMPGSPAEGKIIPGDVILGVRGTNFTAGGHLGVTIADAVIKAEEEAGKGLFTVRLWRDRNWAKRTGSKNVAGVDVEKFFKEVEASGALTEWMGETQRKAESEKEIMSQYPIDGFRTNLVLQLKVMGTYSATSPWDCPVVTRIREDAWKVIEGNFKPDKFGRTKAGWRDAIALVASGKPEHRELVRKWVRTQKLCQDKNAKVTKLTGGKATWSKSFAPLEIAIYYDATGDDYVLPELRIQAIETAMGQSGGGSWGHGFSHPEDNGGQLHGRCPGYGALNAAGSRCFFLLALAKKAGIQDPEVDAAIVRAARFFGTYVDKGCIPYGDHGPYPSDDSNGKNYGAAYGLYVLGRPYEAKYFAMTSANASFTPRGGHASPILWQYTPLSSHIAGPKAVKAAMLNNRWFYTMARQHDGSFEMQCEQSGGRGGGYPATQSTAMYALYYSLPLKQLIITGKDADTNFWMTDKEYEQLLVSARGQMNNAELIEQSGKPLTERGSDELIGFLGHFFPNVRRTISGELAKRFKAGETAIVPKVVSLLDDPDARVRHGACQTLAMCGAECVIGAMSKVVKLLDDPHEFVRMGAVAAIGGAMKPGDRDRELPLLKAAIASYPKMSTDIANVSTAVRDALFPGGGKSAGALVSPLSTEPFEAGYDKELVRAALERIITMDPGGTVSPGWTRETVVELAGPIVHIADELQIMDKMFGAGRLLMGRGVLSKFGFRESLECEVVNLLRRSQLERKIRQKVGFAHGGAASLYGELNPISVEKHPSFYRPYLPQMKQWLQDDPLAAPSGVRPDWTRYTVGLNTIIERVEADKTAYAPPALETEVAKLFEKELAAKAGAAEKTSYCRMVLKDPTRKDYFRQMAALTQLVTLLGTETIGDVAPYLGHEQWRLREHAHAVAVGLVKGGAGDRLASLLATANGENAAGILKVLKDAGAKGTLGAARTALKHQDGVVRRMAIQTVMELGGDGAISEILALMGKTTDKDDLWGCELALLSRREDAAFARQVKEGTLAMFSKASVQQRRSMAWILAHLGGADSIAVLQKAASETKDDEDLKAIVESLSYAPDRAVDQVMLALARIDQRHLDAVAEQSFRRMVGANGPSDVTDAQRLDFAEPMLRMKRDSRLIAYLGKVHTGRSILALFEAMKSDAAPVATPAIISAAGGMEKAPDKERAMAAEALAGVIEYLEVTRLRGGAEAHSAVDDKYTYWKGLQTDAGKVLLKVHKPKQAAIPTFDDKDLDL